MIPFKYATGEVPVEGAEVYLAADQFGENPIDGFEGKTDVSGKYSIVAAWPPVGGTANTTWYLVVRKEGFATCAWPHFSNNVTPDRTADHVILKLLK